MKRIRCGRAGYRNELRLGAMQLSRLSRLKPMLTAQSHLSDVVSVPEGTSRCQRRVSNPCNTQCLQDYCGGHAAATIRHLYLWQEPWVQPCRALLERYPKIRCLSKRFRLMPLRCVDSSCYHAHNDTRDSDASESKHVKTIDIGDNYEKTFIQYSNDVTSCQFPIFAGCYAQQSGRNRPSAEG